LGEGRRLTKSADFERLLQSGHRETFAGVTFFHSRRSSGPPRLGILVTRRHSPRATRRNAIKRCVREAFRLEQERLGAVDLLVRPAYDCKPGVAMISRLRSLLAKLVK